MRRLLKFGRLVGEIAVCVMLAVTGAAIVWLFVQEAHRSACTEREVPMPSCKESR